MNNDKLLVIAKGMGLDNAYLRDSCDGRKLKPNHCEIIYIDSLNRFWTFNPNVHKDQVFEVLEWLGQIGNFLNLDREKARYQLNLLPTQTIFTVDRFDLKENILEIAHQVASELINKVE